MTQRACDLHRGSERPERGGTRGDRTQVPTATELLEEGKLSAHLPLKRGAGTLAVSKEVSRMREERYDGGRCLCLSPSGEPRLPTGPCRSYSRQAEHRSGAGAAEPAARVHVSSTAPVARPLGAGQNSVRRGAGEGNAPRSTETRGQVGTPPNRTALPSSGSPRGPELKGRREGHSYPTATRPGRLEREGLSLRETSHGIYNDRSWPRPPRTRSCQDSPCGSAELPAARGWGVTSLRSEARTTYCHCRKPTGQAPAGILRPVLGTLPPQGWTNSGGDPEKSY